MIGKILWFVFLVGLLGVSLYLLYENIPGKPEEFSIENYSNIGIPKIESGDKSTQFYPNMKFNHNDISYYFEPDCSKDRKEKMERAFLILWKKVAIISFYETDEENADILIGCSEEYMEKEENLFIAGEGGPTKIINTSLYNVIFNGKILLYKESECDYPVVELHELLHVFGFDHINYSSDIMHPIYSCEQRINKETIDNLVILYSAENIPDLYFTDLSAVKRGRYLDFNATIRNRGLQDAEEVSLILYSGEKKINSFELGDVGIGMGKIYSVGNLKLPSRRTNQIEFVIDYGYKEIDKKNNIIELEI